MWKFNILLSCFLILWDFIHIHKSRITLKNYIDKKSFTMASTNRGSGIQIGSAWFQRKINLRPQHRGVHLITEEILKQMPELAQFSVGLCHVQSKYCTVVNILMLNFNVHRPRIIHRTAYKYGILINIRCTLNYSLIAINHNNLILNFNGNLLVYGAYFPHYFTLSVPDTFIIS